MKLPFLADFHLDSCWCWLSNQLFGFGNLPFSLWLELHFWYSRLIFSFVHNGFVQQLQLLSGYKDQLLAFHWHSLYAYQDLSLSGREISMMGFCCYYSSCFVELCFLFVLQVSLDNNYYSNFISNLNHYSSIKQHSSLKFSFSMSLMFLVSINFSDSSLRYFFDLSQWRSWSSD